MGKKERTFECVQWVAVAVGPGPQENLARH